VSVKFTGPSQEVALQVTNWLYEFDGIYVVEIKKWHKHRTLPQNAMMWMWFDIMAKYFSRPGNKLESIDIHDIMVLNILGTEDKVIGKTVIKAQLKKTSDLDTAGMTNFLERVEFWAAEHGLILPVPMGSIYYEEKNRQTE
jgi:hypothetical protein